MAIGMLEAIIMVAIASAIAFFVFLIVRIRRQKYIILSVVTPAGKVFKKVKWDGYSTSLKVNMGKKEAPIEIENFPHNSLLPIIGKHNCYSLEIVKDGIKPISYDFTAKGGLVPKWSLSTIKKYINAKLIERLGELGEKKIPVEILYVACILTAGSLVACIYCINQINGLSKQIADLAQELSKLAAGSGAIGG